MANGVAELYSKIPKTVRTRDTSNKTLRKNTITQYKIQEIITLAELVYSVWICISHLTFPIRAKTSVLSLSPSSKYFPAFLAYASLPDVTSIQAFRIIPWKEIITKKINPNFTKEQIREKPQCPAYHYIHPKTWHKDGKQSFWNISQA